jgi:pyridoxamine 5'-phosphate oxidase
MDLDDLRSNYTSEELRRKDLLINPLEQFQKWLKEAVTSRVLEPNAMVLATCTKMGLPSTRTVLLKQVDVQGFIFFTNYESRKSQEIDENPHVSATFLWKELERQVTIQGSVKKTSRDIAIKYFAKRPRKSQLGTAASHQGKIIPSREILEKEYARLDKTYEGREVPCPEFWGGFIIQPVYYEFWQGRPNRLHDRFRYQLSGSQWLIDRLSP